jgi:hypothetical protein
LTTTKGSSLTPFLVLGADAVEHRGDLVGQLLLAGAGVEVEAAAGVEGRVDAPRVDADGGAEVRVTRS